MLFKKYRIKKVKIKIAGLKAEIITITNIINAVTENSWSELDRLIRKSKQKAALEEWLKLNE